MHSLIAKTLFYEPNIRDKQLISVTIAPQHTIKIRVRLLPSDFHVKICSQLKDVCPINCLQGESSFSQMVSSIHINCLSDNLLSQDTPKPCSHKNVPLFDFLHTVLHIPCYTVIGDTVSPLDGDTNGLNSAWTNLLLPLCVIDTGSYIVAAYDWSISPFTLWQCITHSPHLLHAKRDNTCLVLLHILQALSCLQHAGLIIDQFGLDSFLLDDKCWLTFDFIDCLIKNGCDTMTNVHNRSSVQYLDCSSLSQRISSNNIALWEATRHWCDWEMSNYDYLMYLNRLAGREIGVAHNHPIFPWVCNFNLREGGWRDLTQTKYRLTKGDQQLDEAFKHSGACGVHHHVDELLSDLGYYVYKARVIPKDILCLHVRSKWVPEEYPVSMKRIFDWSPDECIPEFYSDPSVFTSVHPDLANIELPSWCASGKEFINWHRSMLECDWVSQRLHHWIDLVFGYKLVGANAKQSKNVHLSLVDCHEQLRDHGPVQLFERAHPSRKSKLGDEFECGLESSINMTMNPLYEIMQQPSETVSVQNSFDLKDVSVRIRKENRDLVCSAIVSHFHELGVLFMQILLPNCSRIFPGVSGGDKKLKTIKNQFNQRSHLIPRFVRPLLERLLYSSNGISLNDARELLCWKLMEPLQNVLPLAHHIALMHDCWVQIEFMKRRSLQLKYSALINESNALQMLETIAEQRVSCVAKCANLILNNCDSGSVSLFGVVVKELMSDPWTGVSAAWSLFLPIATALEPTHAARIFGEGLLGMYSADDHYSRRHLKIYHRTFLLQLIVRLGTEYFLNHMLIPLVEACAGDRDSLAMEESEYLKFLLGRQPIQCKMLSHMKECSSGALLDSDKDSVADRNARTQGCKVLMEEGEVVSDNMSELEEDSLTSVQDEFSVSMNEEPSSDSLHVSNVAHDSLLWLAHRSGPVLTATHITRNLLRMLSLAFMGQKLNSGTGENSAQKLINCLIQIASIYGDAFIILHYIPFCADIVSQAGKRITASVESGMIACAMLLDVLLPHLTDKQLIDNLEEPLVDSILFPSVRVVSSLRHTFADVQARIVCACRLSRLLCRLGIRIGVENVKKLLAASLQRLFCVYDSIYESDRNGTVSMKGSCDSGCSPAVFHQLKLTFTPDLASYLFKTFSAFCGRRYVQLCLANSELVQNIVEQLGADSTSPSSPFLVSHSSFSTGNRLSGSRLSSSSESASASDDDRKSVRATRELKGNWLAFWKSRIGQDRIAGLTINQVRLQSFVGHGSTVRRIRLLDNENSFISASSDKTVKLWSLRSFGDGNVRSESQWTYDGHKKSVFDCAMLNMVRLVASTDGVLHLWDPFLGTKLREFDWSSSSSTSCTSSSDAGVHLMKPVSAPSTNMIVASANDTVLRILDSRLAKWTQELRLGGQGGPVRGLTIDSTGNWVAVSRAGGQVLVMDLRTGRLMAARSNETEPCPILENFVDNNFLALHPDQAMSIFSYKGELVCKLPATNDSVSCVTTCEQQILCGTVSNKIHLYSNIGPNPLVTTVKLRSEVFSGNLSCITPLTLHNIVLVGSSNGIIRLLC